MATRPSTHSRASSHSSTSSSSSSSTYRLFPRSSKPSPPNPAATFRPPIPNTILQSTHQPSYPYRPSSSSSSSSSSPTITITTPSHQDQHQRQHYGKLNRQPSYNTQLTTSIERTTIPMLAHLTAQLQLTNLETERDQVRAQIRRQETVLTLSMLLKNWGDEDLDLDWRGEGSRWEDDDDADDDADDDDDDDEED